MIIFILLCVAFVVERTVEILVDSKLFAPIRNYIATKAIPDEGSKPPIFWKFIYDLTSCGYCLSVWVAAFYALFFTINIAENKYANFLINLMLLHGLSNIIHVVYMIVYRGQVKYIHLTIKEEDKEDGL